MRRYVLSASHGRRSAVHISQKLDGVNNFKTTALSILNKPFHVQHNTCYKIYPYSKNRFTTDYVIRFRGA